MRLKTAILLAPLALLSGADPGAGERRQVLVYYANETSLTPEAERNWDRLETWAREDGGVFGWKIVTQLERDRTAFRGAVSEEILALRTLTRRDPELPVVVFTNELAKRHVFVTLQDGAVVVHRFPYLESGDYITRAAPLSSEGTLRAALAATEEQFPARVHAYVLHTKSHGGKDHVLVPRIAIHSEDLTRDGFMALAVGSSVPDPPPSRAESVDARRFMDVLRDEGRERRMQFPLVFVDACHGQLGFLGTVTVPGNVGLVYASPEGMDYLTLPYADLPRGRGLATTVARTLDRVLGKGRAKTLVQGG